jgi:hypothetical protein
MLGMGFERLEPCDGKLSSTVLMGVLRSNTGCLPGSLGFKFVPQPDTSMFIPLYVKGVKPHSNAISSLNTSGSKYILQ